MAARDFDPAVDDLDDLSDAERRAVLEDVFGEPLPGEPADDLSDDDENPDITDADVKENETMNEDTSPAARKTTDALTVLEATVVQLDDGEARDPQRQMCELVEKALAEGTHLAVQAGTGVGKSFAYGVPAALHGKRVVIATATKALQDQLKNSDMPMVAQAVRSVTGTEPVVTVLKGRSNYVCRQRIHALQADLQGGLLDSEDEERERERGHLAKIVDFAGRSTTGDVADLGFQPDPGVWRRASVTRAECPGKSNCSFGETCFTEVARERAAAADVVVVNHALYASYLDVKGKVLPEHEAVIIDEVHQFADFVTAAAGLELSRSRFDDVRRGARGTVEDDMLERLSEAAKHLDDALAGCEEDTDIRREVSAGGTPLSNALDVADGCLNDLSQQVSDDMRELEDKTEHQMLIGLVMDLLDDVREIKEEAGPSQRQRFAFYVADFGASRELRGAPLSVGDYLQAQLGDDDATTVVMTSATLDSDLPGDLGFGRDCHYEDVGSPFDYKTNALLYVPKHLPVPNDAAYREQAQAEIETLIGAIGGRTLALFTSWKALNETYEALAEKKRDLGISLYRQGDDLSNPDLVGKLRTDPTAVVCGTMTFWQGVDVPGDGLQLLIMDKLPFPVPSEPLFAARAKHLESDGGRRSFDEMSIPHASRMLAQGLGRLIRTSTDRGVAVVLDSRLATKRYRTRLLEPVPPMRRTIDLADALTFLRALRLD